MMKKEKRIIDERLLSYVTDDKEDAIFYLFIFTQSALHVSGDVFAHHQ